MFEYDGDVSNAVELTAEGLLGNSVILLYGANFS